MQHGSDSHVNTFDKLFPPLRHHLTGNTCHTSHCQGAGHLYSSIISSGAKGRECSSRNNPSFPLMPLGLRRSPALLSLSRPANNFSLANTYFVISAELSLPWIYLRPPSQPSHSTSKERKEHFRKYLVC